MVHSLTFHFHRIIHSSSSESRLFSSFSYPERFNIVGTVGTTSEIGQVKLDLIPSLVQTHRHGTDERLHARGTLVVTSSESSADVLVI